MRRLFAPFTWCFAIRERTSLSARLALMLSSCVLAGVLWVVATDYPIWLGKAIVTVAPSWKLQEGDRVALSIDRIHAQLIATKVATGRAVVRGLPSIAADKLPGLSEANYSGLFATLREDGLGEFAPLPESGFSCKVVDAQRVRLRLRDLGPQPYQLALEKGELVDIEIDFTTSKVKLVVDRVGSGAKAEITLPPESERAEPRLDQYPELPALIAQLGLERLGVHPDGESSRKMFAAYVADPEIAAAHALGPRNAKPPLNAGAEVHIALVTSASGGAASIELTVPESGKAMSQPLVTTMLSPAAIPPTDSGAYPALPALATDLGLSAATGATGYEVADVARARAAGLGLEKPVELRLLPRSTLPSPTEVMLSLPALWEECDLPKACGLTLLRIAKGFGWAVLICLPLGLFMGAFLRVGYFFHPFKLAGMYLPLPALVPLTIAWLGIGEERITLFLAICNGVVMLPFVVAGVQSVPQVYIDTARTLGATRGQLFRYCLLAVSWPKLFDALRLSFAVGWTWIMLAETIGVTSGLGYIINTARRRGYIEHVYIVIALVILLAFVSNLLWGLASRWLFPYVEED